MSQKKIIIVGAGLGGLATALRLASKGFDVTILEKHHQAGGRLNMLEKDGFKFDLGPTFFSMSYEFDELVQSCGIDYPFEFIELEPLFTVNIHGIGQTFTIYKDLDKLSAQFEPFEPDFKAKMEAHLRKTESLYNDTVSRIVHRNFNSFPGYLFQMARVPLKHTPLLFKTMWKELCDSFESKEARMVFSLVGFFLGATPFDTPAVFSLLNYVEMKHDGYHNVKGGMYKIVESLEKVLKEKGVKFHYNTEITGAVYQNSTLKSLTDSSGKQWQADLFVINADAASFRGKILNRAKYRESKLNKMKWTMAPLTIYLGIKGKLDNLQHHNYFLGNNFDEYAKGVFKNRVSFQKPYYYVNVPSKNNPEYAPEGHESLFILCPAPDLRFKPDWNDREEIAQNIIDDLSRRSGYNLQEMIVSKTILSPEHWESMFNLYKGSGLGLAHDLNQIGWFRPSNKDEELKNLYYVGASTIPGTGLPMTVISSKLTTARVIEDLNQKN
ncbi:phytoene desaturase family protein [Natronoflexus pectinivorans]|uniref:Phytoene desaturase n=1 Tax=Natronoflexus pectinivorans TaxID=682526 RepID=A0A4R2GM60_9BACT|nr:phytoene desaturase family protein [Natronoflexus pectinivorans]TCO09850.1 phytoene desaturase [Natronoflexus pectinivorans]